MSSDDKKFYDLSVDISIDVENGPLCLPEPLKSYVLKYKDTENVDSVKNYSEQIYQDLKRIKSIIEENSEYNEDFILQDGTKIKWNRLILPILANKKEILNPPSSSLMNDDRFPLNFKQTLLDMITFSRIPPEFGSDYFQKFIYETKKCAPSLNGTACVGKTTILCKISNSLREKYNLKVPIIKVSKLGGLKYKDRNDLIGMQAPSVGVYAVESTPVSIHDRCPFNNLIWRIIMALFEYKSKEEIVEKLCEYLSSTINYYMYEYMKTFPIAILLDTDCKGNRKRMKERGISELPKVTGCLHRCLIDNYCMIQNVTYFAFAVICQWPCIDVGYNFPLSGQKLDILIESFSKKCLINNKECKTNVNLSHIQHDELNILNYKYAKKIGVFK